jgi:hypothetical protein
MAMNRLLVILMMLAYSTSYAGNERGILLQSGMYGSFLGIVNSEGRIYGQFEYYDKWNEEVDFFENVCTFYFYGEVKSNDTVFLKVGLPGIETTSGKIVLHGNDSLTLYTDFSSGYMSIDFKNEGYSARLAKEENDVIALGIVKDERCYFYNNPSEVSITKAYIVNRDFVSILQRKDQWLQVRYISPVSGKKFIKWIKSNALHDKDPNNW